MNEACSAGTGSFLEEAAYETLGVPMEKIGDIAIDGVSPPNFNDQCAAFIASDIKNAIHEGVAHEDIVAGLVYSICMNYANRVKGNRPVGEKVFMQGGVCYNHAVPLAMATLVGKPIVVPPEPGLMGAFGAALEIKKRIASGLMEAQRFDLQALAEREVGYGKSFTCRGGKEKCDRGCTIAVIELEGKKYPFGGACNRYYNLRRNIRYDVKTLDLVRVRQQLVFEKYGAGQVYGEKRRGTVALTRSFLVNTYYPLYATFFREIGFEPLLAESSSTDGRDRREAAFCYPAELAHGFFYTLLTSDPRPDFIFLPHFKAVPSLNGTASSQLCPLVQGETFYLQSTFDREIVRLREQGTRLLTPLMDLTHGLEMARDPLVQIARQMGVGRREARQAVDRAIERQRGCFAEMAAIGKQALAELEKDPQRVGVVVFGRPYNGFAEEAHMGIPHKLASRGVQVIPLDFLDAGSQKAKRHMYWGMGQLILKTARLVKKHPQLFGTYITNFSCGPDSFIIGYFRSIMGRKPSLTLELDSHTADAGLETRIEAFLDIVTAYRRLTDNRTPAPVRHGFSPARTAIENGKPRVITSDGRHLPLSDPSVTLLFPSMGRYTSESLTAVFRGLGLNALALPPSDETVLKIGRANTSCKECLPLILTTGALLHYVSNRREGEVVVYFMPTGLGPCRFGQYFIFMEDLIKRLEIPDVAMLSLSGEDGYAGLDDSFSRRGWWSTVASDTIEDIRAMLLAAARDPEDALAVLETEWRKIITALEQGDFKILEAQLAVAARHLRAIALKCAPEDVPRVTLTGEIYVRRDAFSRQYLTEKLADRGFAAMCSPVGEWVRYTDYLLLKDLSPTPISRTAKLGVMLKKHYMDRYEKRIKELLAGSGLIRAHVTDVREIIEHGRPYLSLELCGEAILTIGASLNEIAEHSCGVIAIGPFGCMPNRVSESILNETMTSRTKLSVGRPDASLNRLLDGISDLPFLAIESDGSPFPQTINAKLESFCLRARRLHERMREQGVY
jgi:predicted nucleotide-binding protein (sugar kinase/HSP70/actin superfamily)